MATGKDQPVSIVLNCPVVQKREAREDCFGNVPRPTPLPKPCPVIVWESANQSKPNLCQWLLKQCNLFCHKEQKSLTGSRGSSFSILRNLIATEMNCGFRKWRWGQQFSIKFYVFFQVVSVKACVSIKLSCFLCMWTMTVPCKTAMWGQGAGIPQPPSHPHVAITFWVLLSCPDAC